MMFWSRSSSSSADGTSTNKPSKAANGISTAPFSMSMPPPPPSFVLSDQRRQELLAAARANRVSWIDGVDETHAPEDGSEVASPLELMQKLEASGRGAVPSHCQEALKNFTSELQSFFVSLDELKQRIIPNDIRLEDPAGDDSNNISSSNNNNADARIKYRTISQDLREQETQLEKWRRTGGHGILSPVRRKRLTAEEKEMVFLLAFRELLHVLKHPQAAEIVYQVQSFVKKIDHWDLHKMLQQRATRDRPGGHVQTFIQRLVQRFKHDGKLVVLLDENMEFLRFDDESGGDLLHEVLEAFVMEKIYLRTLTPSENTKKEDDALHERLKALAFVEFHHLDLPEPREEAARQSWTDLVQQLRDLPLYMSPRRKMDCILRICQALTTVLAKQNANSRFPSADEFLPALIYLLLKANPPELKRNVNYILEYRNPSKLVSEPGYFFTHLVSSVAFLEQVNGSLLTITPEEFEEGLRRSKQVLVKEIKSKTEEHQDEDEDKEQYRDTKRHSRVNGSKEITGCNSSGSKNEPLLPDVLEIRARRLALVNAVR